MKKFLALLLSLTFLFALTACGEPKSQGVMAVTDGTFGLTPQEYIDKLNTLVESLNDSRYLSIPDYVESGKPILVNSIYLDMVLTADDDGKLNGIKWGWHSERAGTTENVNFYLNETIFMISANEEAIGTVIDELDPLDYRYPRYDTSFVLDGALYQYSSTAYAKYNDITITPDSGD